MKCYELTFYLPQKKRRVNWEAVVFIVAMLWAAVVWTLLLL
jgi:hypothetical protein